MVVWQNKLNQGLKNLEVKFTNLKKVSAQRQEKLTHTIGGAFFVLQNDTTILHNGIITNEDDS